MSDYPPWLIDLAAAFSPRQVPLDVTPEGTYEESTTRWGPNPIWANVPIDLQRAADQRRVEMREAKR